MDGQISLATGSTLRDQVIERIRANIVAGHIAPGTLLSGPGLADELKVSTTPVREALLALARTGLVTPVRNRGFRVEAISLDALNDLFAVRELLERFAVTTLAERRPSDPAALRQLAHQVEAAVTADDVPAYIEADRAFHHEFVAQAANPLLLRLVLESRDAMRLYGIDTAAGRERQRESVAEHFQLIELVEAGRSKEAAKLISSHILAWKPIFTKAARRYAGRTLLSPEPDTISGQ